MREERRRGRTGRWGRLNHFPWAPLSSKLFNKEHVLLLKFKQKHKRLGWKPLSEGFSMGVHCIFPRAHEGQTQLGGCTHRYGMHGGSTSERAAR